MSINEEMEDDGIQTSKHVQIDEETRKRHADLYVAALKGDWSKAEEIFKKHPRDVRAELSDVGDTVLHAAAAAGKNDFLKELVISKYIEENDLKKTNKEKNTAFSIVVMGGDTKLAELMLKKSKDLATICNEGGMLPVLLAALLGNEKMVRYLYTDTKDKLKKEDLTILNIELLVTLINNDLYDFALHMVKEFPKLAVSRVKGNPNENGETALHALARKPLTSPDFNKPKQFSGTNKMQNKTMHPKALELVQLLWGKVVDQLDYYKTSELINKPQRLIFDAAKQGNYDFLSIITSKHPDLIFIVDKEKYSIFHYAVLCRHEKIFKLINERPGVKNVIVSSVVGEEKDNILHLAAKLPDQNRLRIVSGAALQMLRELWWFKEVSMLMPPAYAIAKNGKGKTAWTLFTESHKDLMEEGEKWMKKTAESCMLVATLIATIVFAAAFTVPGGLNDNTGVPKFVKKAHFIIFSMSDTMSLVSSACSILTFLSILTARYTEEDFFLFLPRMLLIGLSTLLLSIVGMMVVFCTTLFIVFVEGTIAPPVIGIVLACIPVMLFIWQQKRLISDVFTHLNRSS